MIKPAGRHVYMMYTLSQLGFVGLWREMRRYQLRPTERMREGAKALQAIPRVVSDLRRLDASGPVHLDAT